MDGQGDLCSARLSAHFLKIESEEVEKKSNKEAKKWRSGYWIFCFDNEQKNNLENLPSDEHVCLFVSLF